MSRGYHSKPILRRVGASIEIFAKPIANPNANLAQPNSCVVKCKVFREGRSLLGVFFPAPSTDIKVLLLPAAPPLPLT
jgi:hypothetical protein